MSDLTTVRLQTSGLHCPSCSMLIRMQLEELPGVEVVSVDHVTGLAEVQVDDDLVTPDELVGAVVAAGYGAEIAS